MKNYIKFISLSLTFLPFTSQAAVTTPSCTELGYNDNYDECRSIGAIPLLCPFYNTETAPYVLCLSNSCRGYPLTEDDLNASASDGKKIREHIQELETCKISDVSTAKTYYRVKTCKSGSLFQNDICDVGCLSARYPYNTHQGDQAGDMRICKDEFGEHYGYETCNEGWTGGWKTNNTGKCILSSCNVKDFPYTSNPNAYYNRGETLSCRVGANPYYRYTTMKDGIALTENVCGLTNEYTLNNAVCSKECHFDNCTKTTKTDTVSGTTFSYNEWSCRQVDTDCRIGDYAVVEGVNVGIITHFPDEKDNHLNIINLTLTTSAAWNKGLEYTISPPITSTSYGKSDGKAICNYSFALEQQKGLHSNGSPYNDFQVIKASLNFAPNGCSVGSICGKGEWFVPSQNEIMTIYNNRYILYNTTQSNFGNRLLSSTVLTSSEYGGMWLMGIDFGSTAKLTTAMYKTYTTYSYLRMLSFTLK